MSASGTVFFPQPMAPYQVEATPNSPCTTRHECTVNVSSDQILVCQESPASSIPVFTLSIHTHTLTRTHTPPEYRPLAPPSIDQGQRATCQHLNPLLLISCLPWKALARRFPLWLGVAPSLSRLPNHTPRTLRVAVPKSTFQLSALL